MSKEGWFEKWVTNKLGLRLSARQRDKLLLIIGSPAPGVKQKMAMQYWDSQSENAALWDSFVETATNNESSFFREAAFYELFTAILKEKCANGDVPLTVLSAGCAAGQEIYSCAIAAHRTLGPLFSESVDLYGVDVDRAALKRGRAGLFREWDLRGLSKELRNKYLRAGKDDCSRLKHSIVNSVTLRSRNVVTPWPQSLLNFFDIVLLRNVVVHFDSLARNRAIKEIKKLVRPGGILVFASTEIPNVEPGDFVKEEWKGFFFLRRPLKGERKKTKEPRPEPIQVKSALTPAAQKTKLHPKRPLTVKAHPPPPLLDVQKSIKKAFDQFAAGEFAVATQLCLQLRREKLRLASEDEGLLWIVEGLCHKALGHTTKAMIAFEHGVMLVPLSWVAHFHWADLLYNKGRMELAKKHYLSASRCLMSVHAPLLDKLFLADFPAKQMVAVCESKVAACSSPRSH